MRTLIVDDEPEARRLLREYCEAHPALHVVGESADGLQAVLDIRELHPELVFMDVHMPALDGFGVLGELEPAEMPAHVVFTTAHDRYALRAFEVAAEDYLLKPFDRARFRAAVQRVFDRKTAPAAQEEVLLVRSGSRLHSVRACDVRWIEACGDYAKVHTAAGSFLATSGLGDLEKRLDPTRFLRVHRSAMLYLPAVRHLHPNGQGGWTALLEGGAAVPVGRTYVAILKRRCV